jgi:hypothetical protein|tara:strand:- start:1032 stop:1307 length:276 start_codon:yes stop_codon:yes gene_type:complete
MLSLVAWRDKMRLAKKKSLKSAIEDNNSIRISYHEKVCAERMKTLFKAIDEMRKDIKEIRADVNKSKGGFRVLLLIGGAIASLIGFIKYNG